MIWADMKFIDFIQLQRGHDLTKDQFKNGPYPVVSSTSIMGYHQKYKAEAPGVVTGRSGTLGKVQYITENYWPHNTALFVKDFKGNFPRFVYYFLTYFSMDKHGGGAAVPTLNRNSLSGIIIRVPDIVTQKRIADVLSAYDDLIENNKNQIKLLEEATMRLYQEWIVNHRFPGHEKIKVINGVPEGWEMKEIGELISKVPRTKQVMTSEYKKNGKIPIIDQSREFIAGYTDDDKTIVDMAVPVIVFGDHTRVLKLINFQFAKGADGTQLIVSCNEKMPQHLLYCSLINIDLSNYHYARHFKYLKATCILIPTQELSDKFEKIVEPYFSLIQNLRDKIILLQNARDILLSKLMSREIEV